VTAQTAEAELEADVMRFYDDPYGFVLWAYPWGSDELEDAAGPDENQMIEMRKHDGTDG
jgi:hypothetical protein